jgi:Rieske Fe-S protein
MGFQMVAVILIFYWAGSKLDVRSGNEKPVYTALLTLLGVFAGLYLVLKDFIFKKDDRPDPFYVAAAGPCIHPGCNWHFTPSPYSGGFLCCHVSDYPPFGGDNQFSHLPGDVCRN